MKALMEYMRVGASIYLCDSEDNLYYKKDAAAQPIKLSVFQGHFYNLRVYDGIPVLEIDGLRMQVMKGFDSPLDYAKELVSALRIRKNERVLDTCMGLGYTALSAAKKGASIVTVEYSQAVLELARHNPFSSGLFGDKSITIISGDVAEKIKEFKSAGFDCVIHDPPRMSHAPRLYAVDFYKELKRILKPGGRLFHYVGSFGARTRGRNVAAEVSGRLAKASFRMIERIHRLQGLICKA